jgi:hypothetical protein
MSGRKSPATLPIYLILIIFLTSAAAAQDAWYDNANPDWRFRASLGFGQWDAQRDLDNGGPGEFDSGPLVGELGIDYRLAEWGSTDVYFGVDGGFMTTGSDIPGKFTSPTSDLLYIAPSVAFYFGDYSSWRLNVRAGVGRYSIEFSELIDTVTFNRTFSEVAFGGYFAAGIDFPLAAGSGLNSITLDIHAHLVDFGQVEQLGPHNGNLQGPIWTIQFGWGRRF